MKNLVINNGAFTAAGNFTGYTALGERVHIFGRQMEAIGIKKEDKVQFPLFVIADNKTINKVDAEGNPTEETAQRLTALSVFAKKEDLIQAHVDSNMLTVEITKSVKATASSAGLTEAEVEALLEATI